LYYGVPLILVPHQQEQMLNARCVEALGAGLIIADQLQHGRVTAATLCQALESMVSKPDYRAAASNIQQPLRAAGGYRLAADEIQGYLAGNESTLAGKT
jgi:UDP:flavonoid glycosyltransferase YjiC (YdhE family)